MPGPLKSPARQFVEILRKAGQHMLDEVFGLGAVHFVQGGQRHDPCPLVFHSLVGGAKRVVFVLDRGGQVAG